MTGHVTGPPCSAAARPGGGEPRGFTGAGARATASPGRPSHGRGDMRGRKRCKKTARKDGGEGQTGVGCRAETEARAKRVLDAERSGRASWQRPTVWCRHRRGSERLPRGYLAELLGGGRRGSVLAPGTRSDPGIIINQ